MCRQQIKFLLTFKSFISVNLHSLKQRARAHRPALLSAFLIPLCVHQRLLGGSSTRLLSSSLWPQGHVHWCCEWGGFLPFACLFPQQHFNSACVASRAMNPSPVLFELLTNKWSISQGERERRERENITASDPAVCKCYTWNRWI